MTSSQGRSIIVGLQGKSPWYSWSGSWHHIGVVNNAMAVSDRTSQEFREVPQGPYGLSNRETMLDLNVLFLVVCKATSGVFALIALSQGNLFASCVVLDAGVDIFTVCEPQLA